MLYVEIVPTTKGIKRRVEKEFGSGFDGVEKQASSVFGRITGFAKGAATAVTGAAAALAGLAIKGGLGRLLNIEDAQAKLKGLGHDAESVTEIMGSALGAVRGTAYGLDTAATVAASAVAAGIKPGRELEKYLRLTADAATIAGTSMDEMGSIINKVTANGRAMTENLYQLQDRGIPIMQWLATEYGVSQDALREMVSAGKVDAETFRRVIEENIGGAALASGDTTRGAFANMLAAVSRVGANFLSGVFPMFREFFVGITELIAPLEARAKEWGAAFGSAVDAAVEAIAVARAGFSGELMEDDSFLPLSIVQRLMSLGEGLANVTEQVPSLMPLLAPLGAAFAALGAGGLAGVLANLPIVGGLFKGLAGPAAFLTGPIGLILSAFAGLVAVSPQLQSALGGVVSTVFSSLSGLLEALAPALSSMLPIFSQIAMVLAGVLAQALVAVTPFLGDLVAMVGSLAAQVLPMAMPLVAQLAQILSGALATAIPLVAGVLSMLMPVLGQLFEALMPVVEAVFALLKPVLALIQPLLDLIFTALEPLLPVIAPLIEHALTPLLLALEYLLPPIIDVVEVIANALMPIISGLTQILGGLIDFLVGVFTGDWERAWKGIAGIFSGVWNTIVSIAEGVVNAVIALINGLINGVNDITGSVGIPKIPRIPGVDFSAARLADGALVPAQPGGIFANIGEGRHDEIVMPLAGPVLDRIREALWDGREGAEAQGSDDPLRIADESIDRLANKVAGAVESRTRVLLRKGEGR
ncbi:tape measure protein [Homoserinibacter sp. GY 40078]|uniref:phage tail protein n=1 Tax=Homoserinibacter sp. GY 40078 TaxID=2603275 RepID=UPI00210518F9|nr:tape measure protein [Homoserinibacter sp. GY 40078]